jgi:predicted DNA-binding WGR domain protein
MSNKNSQNKTNLTTPDSIVDIHFGVSDVKVLCENEEEHYGCTLTCTDISKNSNKFYIIQLLINEPEDTIYLHSRYGRVGEKGTVNKSSVFDNKKVAINQFKKLFKSKTGNAWDNDNSFDPIPGKYFRLKLAEIEVEEEKESIEDSTKKLEPKIEGFISLISNDKLHVSAIQNFNIDVQKMPLGKISDSVIKECYKILRVLKEAISLEDNEWENSKNIFKELNYEISENFVEEILVEYSNKFWTRIPYACNRSQKPPVIKTQEQIVTYIDLLEVMQNAKIAGKITRICNNSFSIYEKLGVTISVCEDEEERELVSNFINNTNASTHYYKTEILDIFCVDKEVEDPTNVFDNTSDHRILTHGTRTSNILGILSEGFWVPRSDQIANGAILGKGIYFANIATKSFNYCGILNNNAGFLFLCEVALGKEETVEKCDTMVGDDKMFISKSITSRWGLGKSTISKNGYKKLNDLERYKKCANEVKIPQGPIVNRDPRDLSSRSSFQYDEFVINDPKKYRFRYVVKIQMKM